MDKPLELSQVEATCRIHETVCSTRRRYEQLERRLDQASEHLDRADRMVETQKARTRQANIDTQDVLGDTWVETRDDDLIRLVCLETGVEPEVAQQAIRFHRERRKA